MLLVHILICVPFSREEGMFVADNLSVKECHHLRILVRQVLDLQVTTQVGVLLVHMLQHHLHIVLVPLGLLVTREP